MLKKLIEKLHPLEIIVLPYLSTRERLSEIIAVSGLKEAEVMRAVEWLENRKLLFSKKANHKQIVLGQSGVVYGKLGLPERRVLELLRNRPADLKRIMSSVKITKQELNASLGVLRKYCAIKIKEGSVIITAEGIKLLSKESSEEKILKRQFPLPFSKLSSDDLEIIEQLVKRGIVEVKDVKDRILSLTRQGKAVVSHGVGKEDYVGSLTSGMLKNGTWKNRKFRPYDISINVPAEYAGKHHFVTQAVEYIRRIWLELGFKEMTGRLVQTAFWDLDALFVPQDHPARDMQDTFYLGNPERGKLSSISKIIKAVHENGTNTRSTGWGGVWSTKEAERLLLRTHTTVLSARMLASLKKTDIPAKYFSIGKAFRNETVDWKHLFELTQVDGIVVDPDANFTHLKGYLREFYSKMGFPEVRIRPAHFPYTEPSCEIEVFHPIRKEWMELGGAGIFRPEVVIPLLGEDIPVLAWGLGLERVIASYYNINDIRDLYKNDLAQLREAKLWVR
jgi:phenylalanyl-tRNA synthetase alpha chain